MDAHALVPRATIEQIVGFRDQALSLYGDAWVKIEEADRAIREACAVALRCSPSGKEFTHAHHQEVKDFFSAVVLPDRSRYERIARRLIDINVWAYMVERTDLERLMDKEAKDQLRAQMAYVPEQVDRHSGKVIDTDEAGKGLPPATVENIYSTLSAFLADSEVIFRRGIANAFAKLDRRFRSHDGFKVGSRVILTRVFNEYGSFSYSSHHRDTLIDIERTFSILDGKKEGSYTSTVDSIGQSRRGYSPHQSEAETEYFRVRAFKNGNAHLWFKRDDLVQKVNQLLAQYYGEVIGDKQPTEEDPLGTYKLTPAKDFGFYPTPQPACDEVMKHVPMQWGRTDRPLTVLEPSAGSGNLARRCAELREMLDYETRSKFYRRAIVDCVEIQPHLANGLEAQGLYRRVLARDFLTLAPESTGLYDRVVMNPPFDRERDIDHVMHALKFSKDDGFLIAIMSAGTDFRATKKAAAFRNLMQSMNAVYRDLPHSSFAEVGTYVNTIILQVWKDGRKQEWTGGRKLGLEQ